MLLTGVCVNGVVFASKAKVQVLLYGHLMRGREVMLCSGWCNFKVGGGFY